MRIRTTLLAAGIAALPALALAQTNSAPATPPAAAGPEATTPGKAHHDRAYWQQRRAEAHQKYQQLSAGDKARFDDLTKQIKQLRQQQLQILGMSKS